MFTHVSLGSITRRIVGHLLILLLAALMSSAISAKKFCDKCEGFLSHFYIGGDGQLRHMDYKANHGHNLFRDDQWGGNIYIGARINCNVGVELGFEKTRTKHRVTSLTEGEIVTGVPVPPELAPAEFRNQANITAPHISLIGFFPTCQDSNLLYVGSIGIAWGKAEYTRRTLTMAGIPAQTYTAFSESNLLPRVMGGLQYQFSDNLSVRGTLTWENTKVLHAESLLGTAFVSSVKPEGSVIVGLGLVWCCF